MQANTSPHHAWALQAHSGVLNAFLPHLDTAGMAESFVRLVGADEQVTLNAQPDALAWIADTDILSRLLERCVAVPCRASISYCKILGGGCITEGASLLSCSTGCI